MAANDSSDFQNFLEDFLSEQNPEIKEEWKTLIESDNTARANLYFALKRLKDKKDRKVRYVPDDTLTLKSLTFQAPKDIKAIIVASDPEITINLASGLAFSFPKKTEKKDIEKYLSEIGEKTNINELQKLKNYIYKDQYKRPIGFAMAVMKIALLRAGVEKANDKNFCYEDQWAAKGVLLLNSALTVNHRDKTPENKHWFWLPFTARLIYLVLRESHHKPVLGMFWGDFATEVFEMVKIYNNSSTNDLDNCRCYNHPTFPRKIENNFLENAEEDFRKLYKKLSGNDDGTTQLCKQLERSQLKDAD